MRFAALGPQNILLCCCSFREKRSDPATAEAAGWPELQQAAMPFQLFYVIRKNQQLYEAEALLSWQAGGHCVWYSILNPENQATKGA